MTQKEIIEINVRRPASEDKIPEKISEILSKDPEVSYTRLNYDDDSDVIKSIISSDYPTLSPFFLSLHNGKIFNSFTDLEDITESNI